MNRFTVRTTNRQRRHRRIRAQVSGTSERPRLSVFRSATHMTAQVIDDHARRTIAAASDREIGATEPGAQRKVTIARAVGKLIAERARAQGIARVVFDRGGYAYHGRVRAVADGAREGGLEF